MILYTLYKIFTSIKLGYEYRGLRKPTVIVYKKECNY